MKEKNVGNKPISSDYPPPRYKQSLDEACEATKTLLAVIPGSILEYAYYRAQDFVRLDADLGRVRVRWVNPERGPLVAEFEIDWDERRADLSLRSGKPMTLDGKWPEFVIAGTILSIHETVVHDFGSSPREFERAIENASKMWAESLAETSLTLSKRFMYRNLTMVGKHCD